MAESEQDLPTISELFQAYYDCRVSKRNSASALAFEENLESNLLELYEELVDGSYTPGQSICFVVEHPKVREVWAAEFRDRIVHHLLYNKVADRFHRRFIADSYACIPGRGTHKAVARLEHMSRSITCNWQKPAFVLKMDVANFFVSIDKEILDSLLSKHIHEAWWLSLCRKILHHDPVVGAKFQSPYKLLCKVPRHKSLLHSDGRGLPIGNLSSQFFANVYMDTLDQYAKHCLKLRRWVRYVDDIVVMSTCSKSLSDTVVKVDEFLSTNLRMQLQPKKTSINKLDLGFDALGYVIRPYARYVRRSTLRNAAVKLDAMCRSGADAATVRDSANSYFGILRQANSWRERKRLGDNLRRFGHTVALQNDKMFTERIPI